MDGSIYLRPEERKALLRAMRSSSDPGVRLRAHVILLLADGRAWDLIVAVLFTSTSTINRWRKRFLDEGVQGILGTQRPTRSSWSGFWIALVVGWVTSRTPIDFGFVRSRWTCATVAVLLREDHGLQVSRETVRRWLRQEQLVWRRPRPVLGPRDPRRAEKLRKIVALLRNLRADEVAMFQDEVDINTNPKIGAMWMRRGEQAEVITPGNNTKRYLTGSLNWRTGELILSETGTQRNADLFLAHLDALKRRFRRYRRIHVICDNAVFHRIDRCGKVRDYLARWGHRIVLHYLPKYAPETNPIERVWWHLHEEITRNHRCPNMEQLLNLVFNWLNVASCFSVESSIYNAALAA
jgi:transposase